MSTVEGYELFNEIGDAVLRKRNRVTVIVNIMEDNLDDSLVLSPHGKHVVMKYFNSLKAEDRQDILQMTYTEAVARSLIDGSEQQH